MTTWLAEERDKGIERDELTNLVLRGLRESGRNLSNIAIVSTDDTRKMGRAGEITEDIHEIQGITIQDIYLALGSHANHTAEANFKMFGNVPHGLIRGHSWKDVVQLGTVPDNFVKKVSGGDESRWHESIPVELDRAFHEAFTGRKYTAVISIGPVFPHEVSGFSNGLKNILVGLGGKGFIDRSHYLGATYGAERLMGRLTTPVREVFNYAHEHYLKDFGIVYVLTVLDNDQNVRGVFVGDDIETHAKAADLSRRLNVEPFIMAEPINTIVVNCNHYHATWVANKAVYRTRMAIKEGGNLVVLAREVKSYADDPSANPEVEKLIGIYGYWGTQHILNAVKEHQELRDNLSVAAHLMHGSSDGKFGITYTTNSEIMRRNVIENVGYHWLDIGRAEELYHFAELKPGFNRFPRLGAIYYVKDPSNILLSLRSNWEG